ncbi:alpha-mannosidase [Lacticaseibacillus jixiensis]|uniref:alpha-mannosidase n=1 Tax=Lacticaseibacillus jixiensis TaxID=3231926 RepID=UPI0036F1AC7C
MFEGLCRAISENIIVEARTVKNLRYMPCDYYQWHQEIPNEASRLQSRDGIGNLDTHYQVVWDTILDPVELPFENVLQVVTDANDMWNTNNPQFIVSVNGCVVRALDMNHNLVVLPSNGKVHVLMNIYTNTPKPDVFVTCRYAKRNQQVYRLYHSVRSLVEALTVLGKHHQDYRLIEQTLRRIQSIWFGQQKLMDKVIACQNLSFRPELYSLDQESPREFVVGHTHIDISWLWTLKQTREKAVRSFANAVYLMNRFPEMTFMSSTPLLYEAVKAHEPTLFAQIKALVTQGRWEPEGAMYVESDVNMPTGEALVRQIALGKRRFKELFGRESEILWLPDCFGFPATLPQIMCQTGLRYFFTSKMDWNDTNRLPNDSFYWYGPDGSKVLAHLLTTSDYSESNQKGTTYNGRMNASQVMGTWTRYQNQAESNVTLQLYGFGDGGGGPTEKMLVAQQLYARGLKGFPVVINAQPSDFFHELERQLAVVEHPAEWHGELYLETHRGTLTNDALLKRRNRQMETKLLDTEFILSSNYSHKLAAYPHAQMDEAWRLVLINQFHDILPGSSVTAVHDEAIVRYDTAESLCDEQILALNNQERTNNWCIVNSTNFTRTELINIEGKQVVVTVPGLSSITGKVNDFAEVDDTSLSTFINGKLDNERYKIVFDEYGQITSLRVKALGQREMIAPGEKGNQLLFYYDYPAEYEAWNIDAETLNHPNPIENKATFECVSNNAFKTTIRIRKKILHSQFIQDVIVYRDNPRIDFKTSIDWHENHKLLRVSFPVTINNGTATYDIQFGKLHRPTTDDTSWEKAKYEVCAQKWADLSESSCGVAILNDCKYGHQIHDHHIYLTLLRSANYPAPHIDQRKHEFTYSLLPHAGDDHNLVIESAAYQLNRPVQIIHSNIAVQGPIAIDGMATGVIVEAVKVTDSQRFVSVRLFQANGVEMNAEALLKVDVDAIYSGNLLDEPQELLFGRNVAGTRLTVHFSPKEIKTLLLEIPQYDRKED